MGLKGQTGTWLHEDKRQRELRNKMTDAEQLLWRALRGRQIAGYKFRRQHPYEGYILDFVCLEATLVVEIDGSQHSDQTGYDEKRSELLRRAGFRVLRFWNNEVLQELEAVKEKIWRELQLREYPSPPRPSP